MLLRTVISLNQHSIYGALADLCKNDDKKSPEDSAEDSSRGSESSGTLYAKEILKDETVIPRIFVMPKMQDARMAEMWQSLIPIRPEHKQRQRENQQFEGGENFDYYVDRKAGWRYHREPRRNPQAASSSSSSTSQWPTSQWQTSWNSWQPSSSEKMGGDFGFLERIQEDRREGVDMIPTHKTWLKTKRDLLLLQESRGNPSLGSAETENTQNEDRSSKRIWWIRMFNHINTL